MSLSFLDRFRPRPAPPSPIVFDGLAQVRAYWEALRSAGHLPGRAALDPRGLSGMLDRVFLADGDALMRRTRGRPVAAGLALASKLGHDPADFTRHYRVPQGRFLALGTDPSSLDGRYYGPLPQGRIRGRARVLF